MTPSARDISYATAAHTRGGRAVIRAMENATGRLGLIRRARGYERELAAGRDFWEVMVARMGVTLEVIAGNLDDIPAAGPLVVVANRPYGVLDGLVLGHILARVRGEGFRILANAVFRGAPELDRMLLPIDFAEGEAAVSANVETRKAALRHLALGGAVGVFPGGTVSTAPRPFGRPMDPGWRTFTAKMISRSGAAVVPIYFDGSRLFQVASHVHATLRLALLLREFRARSAGAGEGRRRAACRSGAAGRVPARREGDDGLPAARDLRVVAAAHRRPGLRLRVRGAAPGRAALTLGPARPNDPAPQPGIRGAKVESG